MNWTCEQIEARLSEYLESALAPADQQAFAAHVQQCPQCAPLVSSVQGLVSSLHGLPPLAEPPRLVYAILDKTLGPRQTARGWRAALAFLRGFATMRFAYGALSVTATVIVLLTASGFNWKHPRAADLHPVNLYRAANRQGHLIYARGAKFVSDLRVVYEIQSRLSQDSGIRTAPESTAPPPAPEKQPGMTNAPRQNGPRQQNRANGIRPELSVLASDLAVLCNRRLP